MKETAEIIEMAKKMIDENNTDVAEALSRLFVSLAECLYDAGYRFQPAADVEEVVRCADCKWWHTGGCAFRQDAVPGLPAKDDFCSHGERW